MKRKIKAEAIGAAVFEKDKMSELGEVETKYVRY